MINYSIIIPHKNIPNLLQRCLDSIPCREDMQIIVVDDNSDKDKVDFTVFPGLNKNNTEVYFTKEGKGAGYARNVGLNYARGKWIIFADADDFFMPCFAEVLDRYKNDERDVIFFRITSVESNTLKPRIRENDFYNKLLDKIKQTDNWRLILDTYYPFAQFIKRSVIEKNNILFQEVMYSNDVLFSAKIKNIILKKHLEYNNAMCISDDVIYCATIREGSLTYNLTVENMKIRFLVHCDTVAYFKSINNEKYSNKRRVYAWWLSIFVKSKGMACFLFPRMVKACGFIFVFNSFLRSLYKQILKFKMDLKCFQ